jgi:hypothetical protein
MHAFVHSLLALFDSPFRCMEQHYDVFCLVQNQIAEVATLRSIRKEGGELGREWWEREK